MAQFRITLMTSSVIASCVVLYISKAMQKRLLSLKELQFQEAVDAAQAMEITDKSTKALQGPESLRVN